MTRVAVAFLCSLASLVGASDGGWPGVKPPELQARGCARITAAGVSGTFVLFDPQARTLHTCDSPRAARRFLPASTFKIANALGALENGVVRDEGHVFVWDGVTRSVDVWNADTDLASAMRNSTVWVYQDIARRTGAARMRDVIDRLEYGNRDMSGGLDRFWLDGGLRISAYEQVEFLDRLRRKALPLSERTQQVVARILERRRGASWVLRAKTGAALPVSSLDPTLRDTGRVDDTGWYVGWVELGERAYVFALNLTLRDTQDLPLRESLVNALLVDNGVLPAE